MFQIQPNNTWGGGEGDWEEGNGIGFVVEGGGGYLSVQSPALWPVSG